MTASKNVVSKNKFTNVNGALVMVCCRLRLVVALLICSFAFPALLHGQPPARVQRAPAAATKSAESSPQRQDNRRPERVSAEDRAAALRALADSLGIGAGDAIADIGAGSGQDSWVFAEIVGKAGTVFSEEIDADKVDGLKKSATDKKLPQVKPVLGESDSPCLPADSVDMAFMHRVYHHLAQPRDMLRNLWQSLKPGGYFVVVDQRRGTLQDWVPRERRAEKHFWIAETTVVREARESGFQFVRFAEDIWPSKAPFVIVFQRPKDGGQPGSDPDAMLSISQAQAQELLATAQLNLQRPAFVALGPARALIAPIMKYSSGTGVDIVLEEWATSKDERPEQPAGVSLVSVMTDQGKVDLGAEPIDAVFFLDTYHLLFHHKTLLEELYQALTPGSFVCILDRQADRELSHREASHRRKISPGLVQREMEAAGFQFESTETAPAKDRFLQIYVRP
jgi:predicted methyltransferase